MYVQVPTKYVEIITRAKLVLKMSIQTIKDSFLRLYKWPNCITLTNVSVFGKPSFNVFTILLLNTGVASECTLVLGQPEVHLQAEMRGERANPWFPPIDSNKDILARLNLDLRKIQNFCTAHSIT